MSSATMTMLGMYNYVPDLFDNLTFPAGIDKDTAVDEILLKCDEFEVLYSNPAFLKQAITHWGKKHYRTFSEWVKALAIEFDPLYNYDRFEDYTDAKISNASSKNGSRSVSATGTSTDESSSNRRDVSAYDSSTYEPREKETGSGDSASHGSGIAMNEMEENTSGQEQTKHTAHLYGNIGVTTSTQMLEDFLRVERFTIYEEIADIFVSEFCIMVY